MYERLGVNLINASIRWTDTVCNEDNVNLQQTLGMIE